MSSVTLQLARLAKLGLLLVTFLLAVSSVVVATASPSPDGASASSSSGEGGKRKPSRQLRVITMEQLRKFDGTNTSLPLLIALDRRVYDVSTKRDVYGPGGGYETFSGRDSTRNFALYSTEAKNDGSCIDDLGEKEIKMLAEWRRWFDEHYPLVGVITEKLCENDDSAEDTARRGFAIPSNQKSNDQQQPLSAGQDPAPSSSGSRGRPSPSTEL
ncbi:unnamed protein product [Tilletia laevis]|uniref:Cytochrome b5 heme-binding domain-containing protein n=2 Tax=Tilletia TaxID=13289 RepID=A0A177U4E4_9BASI|nr:hypothetical protein CF336_g6685 [Tilletia laevis]KAE8253064.1 hypothetical protein A4X03_0g5999 [Tilletia caries]CAD6984375.1 unnamed protein product [Tilletia controversa]KAE8192010.1 hypothetical protein CF335_g5943 [Tilletia laevis]CAD6886343.1 unnamed protein product [Tilletia caries]